VSPRALDVNLALLVHHFVDGVIDRANGILLIKVATLLRGQGVALVHLDPVRDAMGV
jgi:hypothetical protein